MLKRLIFSLILIIFSVSFCFAYNPLITEDAKTVLQGNYLLDVFGGYSITNNRFDLAPSIEYGISDRVDFIGEFPSDLSQVFGMGIALKILLYKDDFLAFSIRPYAGKSSLFLGHGSDDYKVNLSGSVNLGALILYENFAYDFTHDSIFISSAAEYIVSNGFAVTLNIGTKKLIGGDLFAIGGLMYAVTDKMDINFGVKCDFSGNNLSTILGLEFKL
ncbi:MAG: hypothetical protein HQK91_01475 [Nitrospirae bacterium]|nr:hypothetical protein [Nitrospirota bacterium]